MWKWDELNFAVRKIVCTAEVGVVSLCRFLMVSPYVAESFHEIQQAGSYNMLQQKCACFSPCQEAKNALVQLVNAGFEQVPWFQDFQVTIQA